MLVKLAIMDVQNAQQMGNVKLAYRINLPSMKTNANTAMNSCGNVSAVSIPLFAYSAMIIPIFTMDNASQTTEV